MVKVAIVTALVAFSFMAQAETITLECDVPTEREDGTPLDPSEIDHYGIVYDCGYTRGVWRFSGECRYTVDIVGQCTFAVYAVDTEGVENRLSPFIEEIIKPTAPTNLRKSK